MSFNKIIIVGNLGRDPELRYTPQGNAVCNFSVATSEKRKDKSGEWQDMTTWFRVTLWGKQGENASKYLQKGNPVYVEGRLRVEEWTDRDGKNRHTLEIHGTEMHFLNSGGRSEEGDGYSNQNDSSEDFEAPGSTANLNQSVPSDDDIPF